MPTCRIHATRTTCLIVASALSISGCTVSLNNGANGERSAAGAYATSCVTGALAGAVLGAVLEKASGKKASPSERRLTLAKAAAAGCAVGLAATAIGRIMDENQRARHEAEMQNEARRRALEQQQYAQATQRAEAMPAATAKQRTARDAELERARAAYQASLAKPTQVDLGNGGTSTIQVMPPAPATAPSPAGTAPAAQPGCTDYAVLVKTSAGQARQYETWCPNAAGQLVRTDVRDAPNAG